MRTIPAALATLLFAAATARAGDLVPTDGRYGPLRVALHKVDVSVDNQVALTRVEQVFANDHNAQLEAHYVFPVPKGATIIDFSMTINGKVMRGELLEKKRARRIYEGIVRQSRDPGLLEHVGANIFRVRVFPILPRSTQKIELTYTERVTYDRGVCRQVYPLRVPGGEGATRADRFELAWRLSSAVPITRVTPSFPADTAEHAADGAKVAWKADNVALSRDLEIEYRIKTEKVGMDLVAHRPKEDGEGTFLLLITPPAEAPRLPKDITFVFDTSGSMEGARIRQAREALLFCLAKLGPEDRFNILSFSTDVRPFRPTLVAATEENRKQAGLHVEGLDANGGTNIDAALRFALRQQTVPERPHLVLFLTDGEPTAGETNPERIVRNALNANAGKARVFAFGVGSGVTSSLVEDLAEETGALAVRVEEAESIEVKVSRLQNRIAAPVLTDLAVDWGDAGVSSVYPREIGHLYAGTQMMITGRYRQAGTHTLTLRGRRGKEPISMERKVVFPEMRRASKVVPYLWAMRKVSALIAEMKRSGENAETVDQVIALSKQYRIATPYTSFLVLESETAYDRHGIDRRHSRATPPAPARPRSGGSGKIFVPPIGPNAKVLDMKKATEDPIYRKNVTEADHNETHDEEEFLKARGDSAEFTSDKPFQGKGTYDVIGGGGGGSRYGGRWAASRGRLPDAALDGLIWLARHQSPDGSWSVRDHTKQCDGRMACPKAVGREDFDTGVTGLSILSFLTAGYTHMSKDKHDGIVFGEVIRKGLRWMMAQQDPEGCIGKRSAEKYMYSHAICTTAMAEVYGMTGSPLFKDNARKAVDFLVAAQNPGKAWRYSARSGDNDASVSAWCVLALRSAERSALGFPRSSYDGARAWYDEVTDPATGRTGYTHRSGTGHFIPRPDDTFERHETLGAIRMTTTLLIDRNKKHPDLERNRKVLMKDLPRWDKDAIDFCYWHFGSLAIYHYDRRAWTEWKAALLPALEKGHNGRETGCRRGSWKPRGRWCSEGGRIYATAINILTLLIHHR